MGIKGWLWRWRESSWGCSRLSTFLPNSHPLFVISLSLPIFPTAQTRHRAVCLLLLYFIFQGPHSSKRRPRRFKICSRKFAQGDKMELNRSDWGRGQEEKTGRSGWYGQFFRCSFLVSLFHFLPLVPIPTRAFCQLYIFVPCSVLCYTCCPPAFLFPSKPFKNFLFQHKPLHFYGF
jgi:hypothetical protein